MEFLRARIAVCLEPKENLLVNNILVAPPVVLVWWSLWSLLDLCLDKENPITPWWSLFLSLAAKILLDILQPYLGKWLQDRSAPVRYTGSDKNNLRNVTLCQDHSTVEMDQILCGGFMKYSIFIFLPGGRLFNIVKTSLLVTSWWSVFAVCDQADKNITLFFVIISFAVILCGLGVSKTLINAPLSIVEDNHEDTFRNGNYKGQDPANGLCRFLRYE